MQADHVEHVEQQAARVAGRPPGHVGAGDSAVIHRGGLNRVDRGRTVQQVRPRGHVARGVDARDVRLHPLVHDDSAVDTDAGALQKCDVGLNAGGEDDQVRSHAGATAQRQVESFAVARNALNLRAGVHGHAPVGQPILDRRGALRVEHAWQYPGLGLDHRQVPAQLGHRIEHDEADETRSDQDRPGRSLRLGHDLFGVVERPEGVHPVLVHSLDRWPPGRRARGDQQGVERVGRALGKDDGSRFGVDALDPPGYRLHAETRKIIGVAGQHVRFGDFAGQIVRQHHAGIGRFVRDEDDVGGVAFDGADCLGRGHPRRACSDDDVSCHDAAFFWSRPAIPRSCTLLGRVGRRSDET